MSSGDDVILHGAAERALANGAKGQTLKMSAQRGFFKTDSLHTHAASSVTRCVSTACWNKLIQRLLQRLGFFFNHFENNLLIFLVGGLPRNKAVIVTNQNKWNLKEDGSLPGNHKLTHILVLRQKRERKSSNENKLQIEALDPQGDKELFSGAGFFFPPFFFFSTQQNNTASCWCSWNMCRF